LHCRHDIRAVRFRSQNHRRREKELHHHWGKRSEDVDLSNVHPILELNLTAVFALCQEFARDRIRSGRPGKIINLASIMSETVRSGAAVYAMTKGGIRQLTKALAVEWAPHGIH